MKYIMNLGIQISGKKSPVKQSWEKIANAYLVIEFKCIYAI